MNEPWLTPERLPRARVVRRLPPRATRRGKVFDHVAVRDMGEANAILSTMLEIRAWRLERILGDCSDLPTNYEEYNEEGTD